jgi:hypothetical protein
MSLPLMKEGRGCATAFPAVRRSDSSITIVASTQNSFDSDNNHVSLFICGRLLEAFDIGGEQLL